MSDPTDTSRALVPVPEEKPNEPILSGISLIEALKARGARRVYEEQARAIRAKTDRNTALVDHEVSLTQLEEIDTIAEIERKKIRAEYEDLDRDARRKSELFDLELDAEKARLVADRKENEARAAMYEKALNPPKELPAPDPIRAGFETIKLYREYAREIEKEWRSVVEAAGGEEHVDEDDRDMHRLMKDKLKIDMDKLLNRED